MSYAVMQPYLFPYLGYYQLVNSVNTFVFYDDVNFIKRGYINRNNILSNGKSLRFTIPVINASQNKLIKDLNFDHNIKKVLKTIAQSYKKAPYFKDVYPIVEIVLNSENRALEHLCGKSVTLVFKYLGIKKNFYYSSELKYNRDLSAADKLIEIGKKLEMIDYVNSPGGKDLYTKEYFSSKNVNLSFIEIGQYEYSQNVEEFIPHLSMIDVLMWNSPEQVKLLLKKYKLT